MKTLLVSLLACAALPEAPVSPGSAAPVVDPPASETALVLKSAAPMNPASAGVTLVNPASAGVTLVNPASAGPVLGPVVPEQAPLLTLRAVEASAPRVIEEVSFSELRRTPSRFAGRSVRCAVQVSAVDLPFESFLSRFDTAQDLCFGAWSDDQRIWHREEFENTSNRLFVQRGTALAARIVAAGSHERLLLTLRVREIWMDEPWIEVEGAVLLSPSVGEGTILHASRAQGLWRTGQRQLAIGELERALASPLPIVAHAALEEELQFMRAELSAYPERPTRPLPPGENTIYRLDLR